MPTRVPQRSLATTDRSYGRRLPPFGAGAVKRRNLSETPVACAVFLSKAMGFCETSMSDRPEGVLVRMLRWVDSGVGRLLERTGRTEQQVDKTQLAIGRIIEQLNRIEKRLEDIERRLPPRAL